MSEWLAMGGHGFYVWSSFALGAAAVIWNLWSAQAQLRETREQAQEVNDDAPWT